MVSEERYFITENDGKGKTDDELDLVCKRFFILFIGVCLYCCSGGCSMYHRCEVEKDVI